MRKEHDFLGEKLVPDEVYYGVQTMRAKENFQITGAHLDPDFIKSMASVKKASCLTNLKTGRMDKTIGEAIIQAADEIMDGKIMRCDSDSGKKLIKSMVLRTADRQGMC